MLQARDKKLKQAEDLLQMTTYITKKQSSSKLIPSQSQREGNKSSKSTRVAEVSIDEPRNSDPMDTFSVDFRQNTSMKESLEVDICGSVEGNVLSVDSKLVPAIDVGDVGDVKANDEDHAFGDESQSVQSKYLDSTVDNLISSEVFENDVVAASFDVDDSLAPADFQLNSAEVEFESQQEVVSVHENLAEVAKQSDATGQYTSLVELSGLPPLGKPALVPQSSVADDISVTTSLPIGAIITAGKDAHQQRLDNDSRKRPNSFRRSSSSDISAAVESISDVTMSSVFDTDLDTGRGSNRSSFSESNFNRPTVENTIQQDTDPRVGGKPPVHLAGIAVTQIPSVDAMLVVPSVASIDSRSIKSVNTEYLRDLKAWNEFCRPCAVVDKYAPILVP